MRFLPVMEINDDLLILDSNNSATMFLKYGKLFFKNELVSPNTKESIEKSLAAGQFFLGQYDEKKIIYGSLSHFQNYILLVQQKITEEEMKNQRKIILKTQQEYFEEKSLIESGIPKEELEKSKQKKIHEGIERKKEKKKEAIERKKNEIAELKQLNEQYNEQQRLLAEEKGQLKEGVEKLVGSNILSPEEGNNLVTNIQEASKPEDLDIVKATINSLQEEIVIQNQPQNVPVQQIQLIPQGEPEIRRQLVPTSWKTWLKRGIGLAGVIGILYLLKKAKKTQFFKRIFGK